MSWLAGAGEPGPGASLNFCVPDRTARPCPRARHRAHPGSKSGNAARACGGSFVITELEFKSLALQGYNRIPLIAEAFADLETPLSLYLKLAHSRGQGRHSFLLESVVGGERFGRYSFIGLPARTLLRATGFRTEIVTNGAVVETVEGNPL